MRKKTKEPLLMALDKLTHTIYLNKFFLKIAKQLDYMESAKPVIECVQKTINFQKQILKRIKIQLKKFEVE